MVLGVVGFFAAYWTWTLKQRRAWIAAAVLLAGMIAMNLFFKMPGE